MTERFLGPAGLAYYYNGQSQESTYIRPIPSFYTITAAQAQGVAKKEKPVLKKRVPGTDWLCVTTNLGNTFYFNKPNKASVWVIPDEIVEAVAEMELKEAEEEQKAQQEMLARATQAEEVKQMEVDRIKKEMKGLVKRKADEGTPLDELVVSKRTKVHSDEEDDEDSEEGEEEEWQREAAVQLAAEAEEERKRQEEEKKRQQKEMEVEAQRVQAAGLVNMPTRVDLSIDEATALFKVGWEEIANVPIAD
jgi:hypothetical protein